MSTKFRGRLIRGLCCAGIAIGLLAPVATSWGVSVTTSTYATQTNPPTVTAQHPLTTVTNPTSISASVRSDENGPTLTAAHAQAWGSAVVTSSGVTKSASGKGWLDPVAPSVKGETWSSSASGSQYIINSNGPPGQVVPCQFQVGDPTKPGPALTVFDTGLAPADNFATDMPLNVLSLKRTAIPTGNTFSSSFFDIFFSLDVEVTQDGTPHSIFNGSITIDKAGQVTLGGDSQSQAFFPQFLTLDQNLNNGLLQAHFIDQRVFPITVPLLTNDPFDLTFVETMKMGDGVSTSGNDSFPNLIEQTGGGGSFTGTFEFVPGGPTGVTFQALPEPAGSVLAGLGLVAASGFALRRKR